MLIEYQDVNVRHKDRLVIEKANLHVDNGEFIYLIGRVGSGKSSLLGTIYADLPIREGKATVLGYDMTKIKPKQVPYLRRQLGIVFQDFQLLVDSTVEKNLEFVLRATGWKKKDEIRARITEVLQLVEMSDAADKYPHELSGGEQQRVVIARAILNRPKVILADEPTGNLDKETGRKIVTLLHRICEKGTAVIMSTHNLDFLHQFPGIVYRCEGGKLNEVSGEYDIPLPLDADFPDEVENETPQPSAPQEEADEEGDNDD